MTLKEINSLKKLIKLLQDGGVYEFAKGDLSLKIRDKPTNTKADKDITAGPTLTKEQRDERDLYYSAR